MDLWDKSFDPDLPQRRRIRRENPSFSSSLLDAIYRSTDESNGQREAGELIFYRETTVGKKQSIVAGKTEHDQTVKFRRDFIIEKWMDEKKVRNIKDFTVSSSTSSESNGRSEDGEMMFYREATAGKKQSIPAGETENNKTVKFRRDFMVEKWMNVKKIRNISNFTVSSSTSPESTSTAGRRFSTSETELPSPIKPKTQMPKQENGFNKTKSKASKIYRDLKKVKQPISPGGRLASFLNSIFNGGSPKTKQKTPNYDMPTKSKSQQGSSTCSSASSFSRSCLSKTPSSRGNVKRSVRFCPVSVIVDEDCRPCGQKLLQKLEEPIMKKGLKSYENLKTEKLKTEHHCEEDEDDDDDDDDGMSCSSSDLFELDNLSVIGIERYREELPVYETTNFKTNCAIAKGLVV